MNKLYFYWLGFLLPLFFLFSCDKTAETTTYVEANRPDKTIIIKGKVKNLVEFGQVQLYKIDPENPQGLFLTSKAIDGEGGFEFKVTVTSPTYFALQIYQQQVVTFVLNKSDIFVDAEGKANGTATLTGCQDSDLFEDFMLFKGDIETKAKTLLPAEHRTYRIEKTKEFIAKSKNSIVSLLALDFLEFKDEKQKAIASEQLAVLQKLYAGNPYLARVEKNMGGVKVPEVGEEAPDVTLYTQKDSFKLSSLRGKYVLLDFSKFKDTLLNDNALLAKAYAKYKPKGFEMITVSMDPLDFDWQWGALTEGAITWIGVRDMDEAKLQSESARRFGVNIARTPQTFLINPEGKIISREVRGVLLDGILSKIYNDPNVKK